MMRRSAFLLLFLSLPAVQSPDPLSGQTEPASGLGALHVPADHWSLEALLRLDLLMEAGTVTPWGFRTATRRQMVESMERIASAAPEEVPQGIRELAAAYRDRFLEELGGGWSVGGGPTLQLGRGHGELRVGQGDGAVRTRPGLFDPQSPVPLDDPGVFAGSAGAAVGLAGLGVAGGVRTDEEGEPEVSELYAAASVVGLNLWAGRRAPAFGGGVGGTVILSGRTPLDGGGFALAEPVILPWFLRHLGPTRFETHVARFEESGPIGRPWFWTARGTVTPHPRLSLGVNRGVMLGGDGSPPMTLRTLLHTLVGSRTETGRPGVPSSALANQIASVELRYRVPVEAIPVALYVEWGMEDSAGAWRDVPGIIAGVHLPFLPAHPGLSVGLERAHFAPSCCGNPPWYRHAHFTGGWADEGRILGHPLGGHGDEWLLHGRADLMDARLRSSWRLFHRERGYENLLVPDRRGTSAGGALEARWRADPRLDLTLEGFYERSITGLEWTEFRAFVGARALF